MTPVAVGFDLVTVSTFKVEYSGDTSDALTTVFTASELADVAEHADKWWRLAARFAAKEAVTKALGGRPDGATLQDVAVRLENCGAPFLELSGQAKARADALGITAWLISLSHTDDVAGAVVIALSPPPEASS